jgi:hypothetical protein
MKLGEAVPTRTSLAKAFVVRRTIRKNAIAGSLEEQTRDLAPHVIAASGCENPPPAESANGYAPTVEPGQHFCQVIATFPDYALVECMDEDKVWKVPYERDGDEVTCGQPVEMDNVFVPAGDDDDSENE